MYVYVWINQSTLDILTSLIQMLSKYVSAFASYLAQCLIVCILGAEIGQSSNVSEISVQETICYTCNERMYKQYMYSDTGSAL